MRPSAEVDGRASWGSKLYTSTRAIPPKRGSRRPTAKLFTLCLLAALAACSKDAIPTSIPGSEQYRLVADVLLRPTEAVLPPHETLQLNAIVKGARGQTVNGRPVTWSSSDESVAYVDADGNIVAGDEGTATITANVLGVRGKATIDVRGEVVDILVDNPLTNLAEGDVERLTATYVFSNGEIRTVGFLGCPEDGVGPGLRSASGLTRVLSWVGAVALGVGGTLGLLPRFSSAARRRRRADASIREIDAKLKREELRQRREVTRMLKAYADRMTQCVDSVPLPETLGPELVRAVGSPEITDSDDTSVIGEVNVGVDVK